MYRERLEKLINTLRQRGIDALVIVPGANLRYLTGLTSHMSERLTLAIFPTDGRPPAVVLPAMDAAAARAITGATLGSTMPVHFAAWSDEEGPEQALEQALTALFPPGDNPPLLAVEYIGMRVMELRALESILPGLEATDATPLLASLRMSKDRAELAAMEEAVRMIETALHQTIRQIRPGMTELQLASIWRKEIMSTGAEGESFACIVASGPNSANPHHSNSPRALQAGDLIILDGGAVHAGYASDITRTVALGEPGPTARCIYELVLAANSAGRAAVRAGATGEQIDRAARQVIIDGGYGASFLHRTGHGLGLECHELPDIVAGSTQPLAIGTTFTIEPGIYVEGLGGVRIEDDVIITADGCHTLTTFERELLILPA